MLDWGDDGSGLFMKYLAAGPGTTSTPGSELVANGDIELRSGVSIAQPPPATALQPVPGPAAQSPYGRHPDAGLRAGRAPPHQLTAALWGVRIGSFTR